MSLDIRTRGAFRSIACERKSLMDYYITVMRKILLCRLARTNMHGEISYELNLSSWPTECSEERIHFLEHVQVRLNILVWPRGDLLLSLESPKKTTSHLTKHRPFDRFRGVSNNLTDWSILTLRHWGENPQGIWTLNTVV